MRGISEREAESGRATGDGPSELVEEPERTALERGERILAEEGEIVLETGKGSRSAAISGVVVWGGLLVITLFQGGLYEGFAGIGRWQEGSFYLIFLVSSLLALGASHRTRVDRDGVSFESLGERIHLPFRRITGLFIYPYRRTEHLWESRFSFTGRDVLFHNLQYGLFTIESDDGRQISFKVALRSDEKKRPMEALAVLEHRSGLEWRNLGQKGGSREQLETLRRLSGARGWRLLAWLARHGVRPHLEVAGLPLPLYRLIGAALWLASGAVIVLLLVGLDPDVARWIPTVAGVAGIVLAVVSINLILLFHRTERRRREGIQAELVAAQEVQRRLLPASPPPTPGWELAAHYAPAREVAGDYFDFIPLQGGRVAVVIADVSDKGLPAGLLMTLAKGHLTARLEGGDSPLEALALLDRKVRVSAEGRGRMFVTMALVVLDPDGTIELVRAGHEPPLLLPAAGEPRWIEPAGVALGIDPHGQLADRCEVERLRLARGDRLLLCTDGLIEARSPESSEYGRERMAARAAGSPRLGPAALLQLLAADLDSFRGTAAVTDDVTLVAVARRGGTLE